MNSITNIKPIINDVVPDLIESSPKSGPIVLSSTTFKGVGKGLNLLMNLADIEHDPDEIVRKDQNEINYNWS